MDGPWQEYPDDYGLWMAHGHGNPYQKVYRITEITRLEDGQVTSVAGTNSRDEAVRMSVGVHGVRTCWWMRVPPLPSEEAEETTTND